MKKRVVVGLSGGVDSAVAAYLLKKQGYEVIGIYLKLYDSIDPLHEKACCSLDASLDALDFCEQIGIKYYSFNMKEEFETCVIDPFIDEYKVGNTPNPCIQCNKHIKFGLFIEKAKEIGADALATGHYARVYHDPVDKKFKIMNAKAASKDQTYMLYNLSQEQIAFLTFPLGEMESKEQVREIAKEFSLDISAKHDSQEICFVPDNNYKQFLTASGVHFPQGDFVDLQGNILGKHKGIHAYTIGQRKGLGLAGGPYFVLSIDSKNGQVVVGKNEDLFMDFAIITDYNFCYEEDPIKKDNLQAKVRSGANAVGCSLEKMDSNRYKVRFNEKVRAITPGQSLVIYEQEFVYGGGIIESAGKDEEFKR